MVATDTTSSGRKGANSCGQLPAGRLGEGHPEIHADEQGDGAVVGHRDQGQVHRLRPDRRAVAPVAHSHDSRPVSRPAQPVRGAGAAGPNPTGRPSAGSPLRPYRGRRGGALFTHRGGYSFGLDPEQLWVQLEDVDQFEGWWPWLTEFRLEGNGLTAGSVLSGVVTPPLPYRMRRADRTGPVRPPRAIDATIDGDLTGDARLRIRPGGAGAWWGGLDHRGPPDGHADRQPVRPPPAPVGPRPGGRDDRGRLPPADRASLVAAGPRPRPRR